MNCSPPGSSVHEISQARRVEWVAISLFRGSSRPRDQPWVFCLAGGCFTAESPGKQWPECGFRFVSKNVRFLPLGLDEWYGWRRPRSPLALLLPGMHCSPGEPGRAMWSLLLYSHQKSVFFLFCWIAFYLQNESNVYLYTAHCGMSGRQLLFCCYGLLPPFRISQMRASAYLYVQICPSSREPVQVCSGTRTLRPASVGAGRAGWRQSCCECPAWPCGAGFPPSPQPLSVSFDPTSFILET